MRFVCDTSMDVFKIVSVLDCDDPFRELQHRASLGHNVASLKSRLWRNFCITVEQPGPAVVVSNWNMTPLAAGAQLSCQWMPALVG